MTDRAPGRHRRQPTPRLSRTSATTLLTSGLLATLALPASAASNSARADLSQAEAATILAMASRTREPAIVAPKSSVAREFGLAALTAVAKPQPAESRTADTASRSTTRQAAPTTDPAPSPRSGSIISIAASLTGIPYVYGGSTPRGFDCSGYTQYVFRKAGISLPRTAAQQYRATRPVSNPRPGDLVFFGAPNAHHVGIYAGRGMMYDAPTTGRKTQLRKIYTSNYVIRRAA